MIKKITLLLLFVSCMLQAQMQTNAPWMLDIHKKSAKSSDLTIDEISKNAEAYFKTIDKNKKGSGLKPFERWKYHWSFYTDKNGKIKPAADLWNAWEQKKALKNNSKASESNWTALGPFQSSNTYSSNLKKSSGQGRINVIAVDPNNSNTYYVGAPAGGIWKSTDAGENWQPLTDNLPQIGVSGIAINPSDSKTIYIATGDDDAADSYSVGVWKSTDGGASWNSTGDITGITDSSRGLMNEIYIHPNNTETILVATNRGVQKSTNGGDTWVNKLDGDILDLKMKPGDPNIWYAVSSNKFYKSIDGGESFSEIELPGLTDSGRLDIDVTLANSGYVYLVSSKNSINNFAFNGIYKSNDSGTSFVKTDENNDIFGGTQAWYDLAITASDVNPEIVYVGVLDIWKSTDGGNNFTKINDWRLPDQNSFVHADVHFLRFIDGKFFAGTDGGVYVSTNEGAKFTDLSENLAISQFYKISVSTQDSSILAGGLQDNGGFSFNNDTWINYHGGDGMEGIVDPTDKSIHYGFLQYGGQLFKTINNGGSLSERITAPVAETGEGDSGGEWVTPMESNSKGEVFAGYKSLYKLEGNSWVKKSGNVLTDDIDQLEIDPKNDNNMYISEKGDLYKSVNGGVIFRSILPFANGTINDIEISKTDSNTAWVVTSEGVFKTTNMLDTRVTFTDITGNLPSEGKLILKHHERSGNNSIYLGTTLGVYTLNDDTDTWEVFSNKLPNVAIFDLDINEEDSKLFAATYGRGAFVTDIAGVLPAKDVKLLNVSGVPKGIDCVSSLSPTITVMNKGTDVINSIDINYSYDENTASTLVWNGTLNSEQTQVINLPASDISLGNHSLTIEATIVNDTYNTNNTLSQSFLANSSTSSPLKVNSFENELDIFLVETNSETMWELGTPNKTLINAAATGAKSYVTKLSGNHPNETTGYLYTSCYDLSAINNPVMAFKMAFDIENEWDYLVVQYSIDSGGEWNILGSADDINWYNSSAITDSSGGASLPGKQWTGEGENTNSRGGTNADYRDYSYDLSSFASEKNIIFRFAFFADQLTNEEGASIDDFVINGTLSNIDNVLENSFLVYPNPSKGNFNLSWNIVGTADVNVYNYLGKSVISRNNITKSKCKIDLSSQSKGLYFIKIIVDGKQAVKKVILE